MPLFGRKKRDDSEPSITIGLPSRPPGPDGIPAIARGNADYERRQMEFLWRVGRGDAIDRRFLGIWDQVFDHRGQARDEIEEFLRGNRLRPATPAELLEARSTVADLKKLAESAGVAKSGKKAELAARIAEALAPGVLLREVQDLESYRLTDVGEALVAGARTLWKLEEEQMTARMLEALRRGDPQEAASIVNAYNDRQVFTNPFGGDGVSVQGDPVADLLADPAFDALELPADGKRELAARLAVCELRGMNPREWTRYIAEGIGGEFRHPDIAAFLAAPVGGMVVGMDSSPESQLFLFTHTISFRASAQRDLARMREWGVARLRILPADDCQLCNTGPLEFPIGKAVLIPRHWGCRCTYVSGDRAPWDEV